MLASLFDRQHEVPAKLPVSMLIRGEAMTCSSRSRKYSLFRFAKPRCSLLASFSLRKLRQRLITQKARMAKAPALPTTNRTGPRPLFDPSSLLGRPTLTKNTGKHATLGVQARKLVSRCLDNPRHESSQETGTALQHAKPPTLKEERHETDADTYALLAGHVQCLEELSSTVPPPVLS